MESVQRYYQTTFYQAIAIWIDSMLESIYLVGEVGIKTAREGSFLRGICVLRKHGYELSRERSGVSVVTQL